MAKRQPKLQIESIPVSSWGINLANLLEKEEWTQIRKRVYKEAGYSCTKCGQDNEALNAHEEWLFNEKAKTQRLVGIVCVCGMCHDCIHFLRSTQVHDKEYIKKVIGHFMRVNKWTVEEFNKHYALAQQLASKRADRRYKVLAGGRQLL